MALPIAHASAAYLIHRFDRRETGFRGWPRALTYMALANVPDADFLVGFAIGHPGVFHRGVSHTLLAALVVGAALGAVTRWRWRDRWLPATLVFAAVYASHLVLDALTICEVAPAGVQFFWPLSDAYIVAPFTIFTEILVDGRSRAGFVASIVGWPTVAVLAREAAIGISVLAVLALLEGWYVRKVRDSSPAVQIEQGESDVA